MPAERRFDGRVCVAPRRVAGLTVAACLAAILVGVMPHAAWAAGPARLRQHAPYGVPRSQLTLAHAPAALRAAVRRTLGPPALRADDAFQQAKLTASDGAPKDEFGFSVSVSGSTAVVGAPYKNSSTGAAYVFVRSGTTWAQQAELTAAGGKPNDEFGFSVSVSGSTIVVGAPGVHTLTGAAYVFVGSGTAWAQEAELTASDGATYDSFGISVAVSGSTAVVGAYRKDFYTGAAYVFVQSGMTWAQQAKLTDSDTGLDYFGWSVAVSGSTVLVGAYGENSYAGAAYVFARSGTTWTQQKKLTAADGATDDNFGVSVAISGSTAVIGAPGHSSDTGVAYVFQQSGTAWAQQAELTAANGTASDEFGGAVAISGSTVVVGSYASNSLLGTAYVFAGSGTVWQLQGTLAASDATTKDYFGTSVAVSGPVAVVGASGLNGDTGAAYAFAVPPQQAELTDSSAVSDDEFGSSVAISGATAVIGEPGQGGLAGVAYVFVQTGTSWSEQATLTPPIGSGAVQLFGSAVAISGVFVIVGAPAQNSNTGAAYVFVRSGPPVTWTLRAALTAGGGAPDGLFGSAVALSGATALVGAPGASSSTGAAYVFVRTRASWRRRARLIASNGSTMSDFGHSVALFESTALIGAPGQDAGAGAAYVFTHSGSAWSQQAELTETANPLALAFGWSVALSGPTALIGAPTTNSDAGIAYVFTRSGSAWSQQTELTLSDAAPGDEFGASVALSGSAAVVGASGRYSSTGAAYVFAQSSSAWPQVAELTASDASAGNGFGGSVALSGSTVLVGSPETNSGAGSAYVFVNVAP